HSSQIRPVSGSNPILPEVSWCSELRGRSKMSEAAASGDATAMTVGFQPEGIPAMRCSPLADDPRHIRRGHSWSAFNTNRVWPDGIAEYLYKAAAPTSSRFRIPLQARADAWPVLLVCVAACDAASRPIPPIALPKHSAVEFAERAADANDLILGYLD